MDRQKMPKTKFKVGDHVLYQGQRYLLDEIATNYRGFVYAIVAGKKINIIEVEEGDRVFTKVK